MKTIRKKLAINDLPAIDYYNDNGQWVACVYGLHPDAWSVRLSRVELTACYKTEEQANEALYFWLPEAYKLKLKEMMEEAANAFIQLTGDINERI